MFGMWRLEGGAAVGLLTVFGVNPLSVRPDQLVPKTAPMLRAFPGLKIETWGAQFCAASGCDLKRPSFVCGYPGANQEPPGSDARR